MASQSGGTNAFGAYGRGIPSDVVDIYGRWVVERSNLSRPSTPNLDFFCPPS